LPGLRCLDYTASAVLFKPWNTFTSLKASPNNFSVSLETKSTR